MASNNLQPPLEVKMTTDGVAVCQRCRNSLNPGEELTYVKNKDPTKRGKLCCDGCIKYYWGRAEDQQPASIKKGQPKSNVLPLLHPAHAAAIHSHFNEAHRGTGNTPVMSIGHISRGQDSKPSNSRDWKDAVLMPPPSGPAVATPRLLNNATPIASLTLLSKLKIPSKPGYQESHQFYKEMREYMAGLAYASDNAELITFEVSMKVMTPGKVRPVLVGNVMETQKNIPVHIGVEDLKILSFYTALPSFHIWSFDYPLDIQNIKLRDKNWVEFVPRAIDDRDAISDQFFISIGGKTKGKKFKTGQAKLILELDYKVYQKIIQYREQKLDEQEAEERVKQESRVTSQPEAGPAEAKRTNGSISRKRSMQTAPSESAESHSKSSSMTLRSPDSKRLRVALGGIKAPAQKIIQNLMANHIMIEVIIYKPLIRSWDELLSHSAKALLDPTSSVYSTVHTSLTFRKDANPCCGVFKLATFGHSTSPIFHNSNSISSEPGGEPLCLKQAIYQSSQTGKRKPYDAAMQISTLVVDICCLRPLIPILRFTSCGLAISDDRNTVYLVEEFIDEKQEGRYVKYINNSSPKPLWTYLPDDEEYKNIAYFLCFCQHVQYKLTSMAYISDLQGGLRTLSDPQIITSLNLGKGIFGEGNIGFESFEEEHECNYFCEFYGLQPFIQASTSMLFQTVA
ncbi:hypothetical protein CPB84DRAFT_1959743 [Gymnopilus junonius]|uniref:Alpha-type protein kinase domain-containing protein n=2 Tax=Gymnopilus junonius TaxID=109634 RepID=A0A9P5TRB5_GYMJU|nr:hypothetical protein CPB84DRAFT_1959743 [Gymnopilus junonius]